MQHQRFKQTFQLKFSFWRFQRWHPMARDGSFCPSSSFCTMARDGSFCPLPPFALHQYFSGPICQLSISHWTLEICNWATFGFVLCNATEKAKISRSSIQLHKNLSRFVGPPWSGCVRCNGSIDLLWKLMPFVHTPGAQTIQAAVYLIHQGANYGTHHSSRERVYNHRWCDILV